MISLISILVAGSVLASHFCIRLRRRIGRPSGPSSELVVLHVSVRDRGGRYITGLTRDAFTVIDDGKPQTLEMFSADEVPASVGFLIDNSNSMRPSRERVIASSVAFAKQLASAGRDLRPDVQRRCGTRGDRRVVVRDGPGAFRPAMSDVDRRARHDRDLRRHRWRAVAARARQAHAPGADRRQRRRRQREQGETRGRRCARARIRRHGLHGRARSIR